MSYKIVAIIVNKNLFVDDRWVDSYQSLQDLKDVSLGQSGVSIF